MIARRSFGSTGMTVPVLTLGTNAFAAPCCDLNLAEKAVVHAAANGIDCLEIYAAKTEMIEWLGSVLRRSGLCQSTSVLVRARSAIPLNIPVPHMPFIKAYDMKAGQQEAEATIRRLGIERIALLQLHGWCPEWLNEGDWSLAFERMRSSGTIAASGISLLDHDIQSGAETVATKAVDAVQAMYNVFDPSASGLFKLAADKGLGVVARSPLYFGALAGSPSRFAPSDWRADYFYEEHARETALRAAALGAESASLALRHAAFHPAVSTLAVGLTSPEQVASALAAIAHGPLPEGQQADLNGHAWLV